MLNSYHEENNNAKKYKKYYKKLIESEIINSEIYINHYYPNLYENELTKSNKYLEKLFKKSEECYEKSNKSIYNKKHYLDMKKYYFREKNNDKEYINTLLEEKKLLKEAKNDRYLGIGLYSNFMNISQYYKNKGNMELSNKYLIKSYIGSNNYTEKSFNEFNDLINKLYKKKEKKNELIINYFKRKINFVHGPLAFSKFYLIELKDFDNSLKYLKIALNSFSLEYEKEAIKNYFKENKKYFKDDDENYKKFNEYYDFFKELKKIIK
jgi:hypothetical protein